MANHDGGPTVAIGLPMYNADRFLAATLESVRAQTFANWVLVVSDNASTDGSVAMVQAMAAEDDRIRLVENDVNRGAVWNYNNTFHHAPPSTYFMWLGADDVLDPHYLQVLVDELTERADLIGAYSQAERIDETGATTGHYLAAMARVDLDQASPASRHRSALLGMPAIVVFGVFRTDVMAQSTLHSPCVGGDRTFVCDMALRGRMGEVDQTLFQRRVHRNQYSGGSLSRRQRRDFMGFSAGPSQLWQRLRVHQSIVTDADLSRTERLRCLFGVFVELPALLAGLRVRKGVQALRSADM